jgi:tRNA (guanosine-2'-O-)-methyltransferase
VTAHATEILRDFIIPQVGIIKSLNISVACAVTLYEAFRQRKEKGYYENPRLDLNERKRMEEKWKIPVVNPADISNSK